jgi:uncharacterized protein (TIGR03435 family)
MAIRPVILLLMTTLVSYGQRGAEPPKYEVASIKANNDNDFRFAFRIEPNGTLAATGITLKRLMMTAFNVQDFRIVGGPGWVASKRWNLQAKPNRAASPDQVRLMLQTVLEDRFQLHSHLETRNLPVYELVVDRKGSKIRTTEDTQTKPTVRATTGLIELTNATSTTFASQLSYAVAQPVIDKTSLSGNFDFAITWTPEPGEDGGPISAGLPPGRREQSASTVDGPSIFTAIREQLGLRLKSARGAVEVIVIDDAQMPTAN